MTNPTPHSVSNNAWDVIPTLVGRHVRLRPLKDDDRDGLLALGTEGEAWDEFYAIAPTPATIDEWMAKVALERTWGRTMSFAICRADNTDLIGTTRFMRMSAKHRRVEIGATFYAASVRRSGVNTEAKRLLLGYAFEKLLCNVVQIRTDFFHRRSRQAIERLGARQEGVLRRHSITVDGRVRDLVVYSIIADEWPEVRHNIDHLLAAHEDRGVATSTTTTP